MNYNVKNISTEKARTIRAIFRKKTLAKRRRQYYLLQLDEKD